MPWTPDTPYVVKLFSDEDGEPKEMFYETAEKLEREIEKHKRSGLYARIWSGHGKSDRRNEWEEIGEWKQGN